MEIDFLMPRNAFRNVANTESRKRARSPSLSPAGRSSKRQFAVYPNCHETMGSFMPSPMLRSRTGDEWVDQTREMSITSNSCHLASHDAMDVSMRDDVQMVPTGSTATDALESSMPPCQTEAQDPGPSTTHFFRHRQNAEPNTLILTPQYASFPSQAVPPHSMYTASQASPPSFTADDRNLKDIDASPVAGIIPSTATVAKLNVPRERNAPARRVAMGYRADCEKCRQKVPGHWMHFIDEDK